MRPNKRGKKSGAEKKKRTMLLPHVNSFQKRQKRKRKMTVKIKKTRPIVQRCVLSVLRYAFCDGGGGGVGGDGVGGGGGGGGSGGGSSGGSGGGRDCGILSPRMILSS